MANLTRPFLTTEEAWGKLESYFKEHGFSINMLKMFREDPKRFESFRSFYKFSFYKNDSHDECWKSNFIQWLNEQLACFLLHGTYFEVAWWHTWHKLWTEICEIRQMFKGDLMKFCEIFGNGYPHDGRADKNPYPHDRRADKDSYPHDSNNQCIILRLQLSCAMINVLWCLFHWLHIILWYLLNFATNLC